MEQTHHVVDLHLEPHEASGLVGIRSRRLKKRLGWAPAYGTILDDGKVEDCIAVIGQVHGTVEPAAGWSSRLLRHHPEAVGFESAHWRAPLPDLAEAFTTTVLDAEHVHTFDGRTRVEGIAADDGAMLYVSDEDSSVRTRFFGGDRLL